MSYSGQNVPSSDIGFTNTLTLSVTNAKLINFYSFEKTMVYRIFVDLSYLERNRLKVLI